MKRIPGEWRYFDETLNTPYPWYTSTCLEFLETLEMKGKSVFEYGVGDSTAWWRMKTPFVSGVDNDVQWALKVGSFGYPFFDDYVSSIKNSPYKPYDIVIIDGAWRDDCVAFAVEAMKPGGLLIIDNFEQPSVEPNRWDKTYELVKVKKSKVYFEPLHEDWKTLVVEI